MKKVDLAETLAALGAIQAIQELDLGRRLAATAILGIVEKHHSHDGHVDCAAEIAHEIRAAFFPEKT